MRFFSSSALASAEKLRLAASCSAAETIRRSTPFDPGAIWGSGRLLARLCLGGQNFDRAASLFDRGDRRFGRTVDRKRHFCLDFVGAEEPDAVLDAADQAGFDQSRGVHLAGGIEQSRIDCRLDRPKI